MTESKLREQLRKISALYEGATTPGERAAAAAAMGRVRRALSAFSEPVPVLEYRFKMPDLWHQRMFCALCRVYGVEPYRYKRQRLTTVVIRAPKIVVERHIWPEYLRLRESLRRHLEHATDHVIREEMRAPHAFRGA